MKNNGVSSEGVEYHENPEGSITMRIPKGVKPQIVQPTITRSLPEGSFRLQDIKLLGTCKSLSVDILKVKSQRTLPEDVGSTVQVRIDEGPVFGLVQPSVEPFPAETAFIGMFWIIIREFVIIQERSLGRIGFILGNELHGIFFTKIFQGMGKNSKSNGNKRFFRFMGFRNGTAHHGADIMLNTIVDDIPGRFFHDILLEVRPSQGHAGQPFRIFHSLFLSDGKEPGVLQK